MAPDNDTRPPPIPLTQYREYPEAEMRDRASSLLREMRRRRSVRHFSSRPVPQGVIEDCLCTAGTAPSGANLQPWHFVVVEDPAVKRQIRQAAERAERHFYQRQAGRRWLEDLARLGTGPEKPFLEDAPCLIAVFVRQWGLEPDGGKRPHYYPTESVAIAVGMLIAALHHAGLAVLTYTPSSMGFLGEILGRPENERPMMVLVTGFPAEGAVVPDIGRKSLDEMASFIRAANPSGGGRDA